MIGRPRRQSRFALRFFVLSAAVFGLAVLLGWLVIHLREPTRGTLFAPIFWVSTLALALGSVALEHALSQVRIERQGPFRRSLIAALAAGTAFVALQTAGLYWITRAATPSDPLPGVAEFVLVLTAMHALHFTVALMFLVFVTLRALDDRYDHEYYWGVVICTWFWHFLGIVWLGILCVFLIAT